MSSYNSFGNRLGYYQGNRYDAIKGIDNARRTTAFAKLYDKSISSASKSKTQMCRSVTSGIPCRFGNKCSYAHSKDELKTRKCAFGTACRTRYSKTNPCRFDHSEEVTPEVAKQATLAQEVKSFWEEEQLLQQAASAWINSFPKSESPKPFLIHVDVDLAEGYEESIPIQIIEDDNDDEIEKAILEIMSFSVKVVQVSDDFNTMNKWESHMPFVGSSLLPASV